MLISMPYFLPVSTNLFTISCSSSWVSAVIAVLSVNLTLLIILPPILKSPNSANAGHVARMEEGRSAFKILTGKPIGKRPLERPRRRWEDIIRMDLKEIGINTRNWIFSTQDRDYWKALVNLRFHMTKSVLFYVRHRTEVAHSDPGVRFIIKLAGAYPASWIFGKLLAYSSNPGLESQQRLRDSTGWCHVNPNQVGWSFTSVCLKVEVSLKSVSRPSVGCSA